MLGARVRAQLTPRSAIALVSLPLLVCLGKGGSPTSGLLVDLRESGPVYARLARLPKDALIAGWPSGIVDDVPYAARRAVLVNYESHQAFHTHYTLEMRRRTNAVIAAYFATSPAPLEALRDDYGVTHMLVDLGHFRGQAPRYFKPFDTMIERAIAQPTASYELPRQAEHGEPLGDGRHVLIDLRHVGADALAPSGRSARAAGNRTRGPMTSSKGQGVVSRGPPRVGISRQSSR